MNNDERLLGVQWKAVGGCKSAYSWVRLPYNSHLNLTKYLTYPSFPPNCLMRFDYSFQECQHADLQSSSSVSVNGIVLTREHDEWRTNEKAKGSLLTAAKTTVLQEQLENSRQLVEMEPDCKWPLLTTALLMNALEDPKYTHETLSLMDKLTKVDPCRKKYYEDLKSKLIIEKCLQPNAENVDLSNKGITCLRYCHLMSATVSLNLSGNLLREDFLHQLRHCARLKSLVLDDNPITTLSFLVVVPTLRSLSIRHCGIVKSFT